MIRILNVLTLAGQPATVELEGRDCLIDGESKLTLLPALIHPYFYSKTWEKSSKTLINNGITTVIERTETVNKLQVLEQIEAVRRSLENVKIPLNYYPYIKAEGKHLKEIGKAKKFVKGITFPENEESQSFRSEAFQMAAIEELPIIMEGIDPEAVKLGIELTEKYDGQLLLTNVSAVEIVNLVREAKKRELLVYCEALFYDLPYFWIGIKDGTIDMVGCDFKTPESLFFLPLLLNAYNQKKISLEGIVNLTKTNVELILNLQPAKDFVLVDLNKSKEASIENGKNLQGWPIYTIMKGQVFSAS